MARTIQSPGVEVKEIDLSLRPNLPVGTTVFIPGFANQGPTDELLTVTSLTEFEQIYGLPQNAAERYMYHSVKAIFQSPANVLVTRLPYGGGEGETVADHASVQVYPVIPRPQISDLADSSLKTIDKATESDAKVWWDNNGDEQLASNYSATEVVGWSSGTLKEALNALVGATDQSLSAIWGESGAADAAPEWNNYELDGSNLGTIDLSNIGTSGLMWDPIVEGDEKSIPAYYLYQLPAVGEIVANVVSEYGWDLNASDRYYLGEPSNLELDGDEYTKLIKGQIKLKTTEAGKKENQTFTLVADLETKGGVGAIVINNKKFIVNEKFEGYYIGLSDNTNLNPATDFNSVGKLKSLSKRLGGTSGGYVNVPDEASGSQSRLTFSLSAGHTFDQFGNRKQVGLDGSMSEVLENLSDFDLGTDEFSDVLTLGLFKIRQSTLEPDANKLDYMLADSVVGSVNHFRERYLSSGGNATSYFIESEAEGSANLILRVNDGISKDGGNWVDETGFPTKKIRILPSNDVRTHAELVAGGVTPTDSAKVADLKVSQNFLNGKEQNNDRAYIGGIQALQRTGTAPVKHGRSVYPHGVFRKQVAAAKDTGNIPAKLERVFELADNFDLFPIDITIEAGLGTVFVGSFDEEGVEKGSFDEDEYYSIGTFDTDEGSPPSGASLYTTKVLDNRSSIKCLVKYDVVFDAFKNFCQFQRKDNIFIADPLRYIFVQGKNSKTLTATNRQKGVNFSQHIYWPLRHAMTGGTKNSNYCCSYANWAFTNDKVLNRGVWIPMSGFAAANMGNTDSNFYPWFAPAGFTRGLLSGIQDLAFYPKQKERDQLYTIGLNPVANFPNEGFVIFGQKTMQAKPSAFDRINVRRLFLYLQKAVLNTAKYFVFEPNTLFTRTQVMNVLRPIFEEVKNTQGMYDYLIVCDERNNTPSVIDRNELVIDIYIKPTRAAEFILVNFYATRTGQDFSELIT
jgi:hypothetical protein